MQDRVSELWRGTMQDYVAELWRGTMHDRVAVLWRGTMHDRVAELWRGRTHDHVAELWRGTMHDCAIELFFFAKNTVKANIYVDIHKFMGLNKKEMKFCFNTAVFNPFVSHEDEIP
jgi:hypothetical protein